MKQKIEKLISNAALAAQRSGELASAEIPDAEVEEPKAVAHGDFSTNIAMVMASRQRICPTFLSVFGKSTGTSMNRLALALGLP